RSLPLASPCPTGPVRLPSVQQGTELGLPLLHPPPELTGRLLEERADVAGRRGRLPGEVRRRERAGLSANPPGPEQPDRRPGPQADPKPEQPSHHYFSFRNRR